MTDLRSRDTLESEPPTAETRDASASSCGTERGEPGSARARLGRAATLDTPPGSASAYGETLSSSATGDPASLVHGARIGRYLVVGTLGAGAMGVVLAAYDPELDRKVAVKLLKRQPGQQPGAQTRLWREAQALAKLDHRNVVTVFDVGTHGEQLFVTMEFVEGQTLRSWLREVEAPRPWPEVLRVFMAAGRGLAAAHEAGLIHRDFKPDNVMLGDDGHVRVMDFGLARAELQAELEQTNDEFEDLRQSSSGHALIEPITRVGSLLGTPAYMAPEQLAREPADARSDQFGFCVALWEALYGQRPFAAQTFAGLRDSIARGVMSEPPRGSKVPAWLRRVVSRGLASDPARRWPSMQALLDGLADDPAIRRRKWWAAAAVVGLLGGATWGLTHAIPEQVRACTGVADELAIVWNDARRGQLEAAIMGTDLSFAAQTWARIEPGLDAYASSWVAARVELCEATERGQQSARLLDQRVACLDERLAHLRATLDELADADTSAVVHAVEAVARLPRLDRCADVDALLAEVPPPEDKDVARRVASLDGQLVEARAKHAAGRYDPALELASSVASSAKVLAYEPLQARAWLVQGHAQLRLSKTDAAAASFELAMQTSVAQRMRVEAASAAASLMFVIGVELARNDEGRRLASVALALARAAGSEEARATYLVSFGHIADFDGEYAEARESFEQAVAIREGLISRASAAGDVEGGMRPEELDIVEALEGLALTTQHQGEYAEAVATYERALAFRTTAQGAAHPNVAGVLNGLGVLMREMGRFEVSRDHHERSLAIYLEAFGPEHLKVAMALDNLGNTELSLGLTEAALERHEQALDIREVLLGPEHPDLANALINLGNIAHEQKDYAAARGYQVQALKIFEAAHGPEHPSVGIARLNLGNGLKNEGDYAAARVELERSLAIFEVALGPDHAHVAYPATSLGDTLIELGQPAEALAPLERALAIRSAGSGDPATMGRTRFMLARALWAAPASAGGDRSRARALAERALTDFAGVGERGAEAAAWVVEWQGERGLLDEPHR